MSSFKSILGVLVGGVAIGATLGVLFAPSKGSATRKKITKKSKKFSKEMEKNVKKIVDGVNDKVDDLQKEVADIAKNIK